MSITPSNMLYGTSRLQNYSKNKFRLLPTSASTLGAFGIIQVPIVQGTIVDLASLKLQMKVSATGSSASGIATDEIYARLPADVSSLIQRVEVLVNGVLVNGSSSDYGSCARLRKLCMGTFDRDQSIDRAVSHASISSVDANEVSEVVMKDWLGTLFAGGEEGASCRFLHTGLCGDITLRIQLGGNNVLVGKQQGQAINANYTTPEAIANAKLMSYKVEDIKFSIEAVSMPDDYEVLLMKDLMAGSLEVGYEEMYSFPLQNITGDSFENRFSVSTRSLNQLYAGVRDSNFQTTGVRAHLMDNVVGDAIVSNAYRFRAYPDPTKQLAWQFSVNNQKHPNYPADLIEACADTASVENRNGVSGRGNLITSFESFKDGVCVFPLSLKHNGGMAGMASTSCASGLDTRSTNMSGTFEVRGMATPTADPATGETAVRSALVCAVSQPVLIINPGKSVSVSF